MQKSKQRATKTRRQQSGPRGFPQEVVDKVLLWCDRHCCLCRRPLGTDIEVHHLDPKSKGGDDSIDNAIPLCFECHARVEHYNTSHPRGRRYRVSELKRRREQVYDNHTRHLVPGILVDVTQEIRDRQAKRSLPDVGCTVKHKGNGPQVRLRIKLVASMGNRRLVLPRHYGGVWEWNLNRDQKVWGHFSIPRTWVRGRARIKVVAYVTVIDVYGREHDLLPMGFIYLRGQNSWYYEPCPDRV